MKAKKVKFSEGRLKKKLSAFGCRAYSKYSTIDTTYGQTQKANVTGRVTLTSHTKGGAARGENFSGAKLLLCT